MEEALTTAGPETGVKAALLIVAVVVVVAIIDRILYLRTEEPTHAGAWVVAAVIGLGVIATFAVLRIAGFRLGPAAGPVLVLVVVTGWATWQSLGNIGPDPCYQLNDVNVGALPPFNTQNTSSNGPDWINILTDGIEDHPTTRVQSVIAKAVNENPDIADQLVASMPQSIQSVVRRLVAVAGSSSQEIRSSPAVTSDVSRLSAYAFDKCGDSG